MYYTVLVHVLNVEQAVLGEPCERVTFLQAALVCPVLALSGLACDMRSSIVGGAAALKVPSIPRSSRARSYPDLPS